jgi:hypothetical protein
MISNSDVNFNDWAFQQCVIKGHKIDAIKNEAGENVNWVNTTTGEHYHKQQSQ